MSRIETITGNTSLEVMSPITNMNWDPVTNSGFVTFNMAKYMYVDGEIRSDISPSQIGMLTVSMSDIMTRSFITNANTVDPVTGESLANISTAGVMLIIKAAFNELYSEQFAATENNG